MTVEFSCPDDCPGLHLSGSGSHPSGGGRFHRSCESYNLKRQKISDALRGRESPTKGRPPEFFSHPGPKSPEHRRRIGDAQRGVPKSPEHRAAIKAAAVERGRRQREARGVMPAGDENTRQGGGPGQRPMRAPER